MEEAVGFEPTDRITTTYGFQDRCFKPLNHASIMDFFGFKPLLLIIDQLLTASPTYQFHDSNIWWSYRESNPTQMLAKHLPSPEPAPKWSPMMESNHLNLVPKTSDQPMTQSELNIISSFIESFTRLK